MGNFDYFYVTIDSLTVLEFLHYTYMCRCFAQSCPVGYVTKCIRVDMDHKWQWTRTWRSLCICLLVVCADTYLYLYLYLYLYICVCVQNANDPQYSTLAPFTSFFEDGPNWSDHWWNQIWSPAFKLSAIFFRPFWSLSLTRIDFNPSMDK